MKRYIIIICCFAISLTYVTAQTTISEILKSIEENNTELQANKALTASLKFEAKAENNLPDPSISYNYLFGSPEELGKTGELTISQGFDFPTQYGNRSKLNKLKSVTFDDQYELTRRDILLRAQELCLDLIMLNQEQEVLKTLFDHANELTIIYQKRLDTGDANILEVNKIKMEYLNASTAMLANENDRQAKLRELIAMNGNLPIIFTETNYPLAGKTEDFESLKQSFFALDKELQAYESETKSAQQEITVNKSGWLPKLEVGYRRNTGKGEQFNGFMVGASIPIFENKNKVKAAKAQATYNELRTKNLEEEIENNLLALYHESQKLKTLMDAYDLPLLDNAMELLKTALNSREISITDYFTELRTIYESKQGYLQLENRYQKIIASLVKNEL